MDTWTCDDSGYGYGDWKNILEYDSYDGKKTKKTKKPKTIYPAIKQQGPSFKPQQQNLNPVALPFQNDTAVSAVYPEEGNCYLFALSSLVGVANCTGNDDYTAYYNYFFGKHMTQ